MRIPDKQFKKKIIPSLGFFLLVILVLFPFSTQAFSTKNDFINLSLDLNIDFSPTITKIHSLQAKVESSLSSLTTSVLDAVREFITPRSDLSTTTLRNAFDEYISPPQIKIVQSSFETLVQGPRGPAGLTGPAGPQGKEGPQGIQGPPGTNGSSNSYPAVIYTAPPAPTANFSGASYFSATNITSGLLSADTLKVTELKVSGSSTFTGGLNVTGASTFGALTVTSCTGCSPTTSLALSTAITDETGSGSLVFANTPTLVTPILGVATITSIAIGANTLDTTEWAFLDGLNQTLATTSSPSFTHLNLPLQGELRLKDADSSNYVRFKSPSVVGSNQIWTLPSTDSSGCFQSNGVGLITIAACSGAAAAGAGITNDFRGLQLRTSPDADLAATTVTM